MWWLCTVDLALPIGDLIYFIGVFITCAIVTESTKTISISVDEQKQSAVYEEREHTKNANPHNRNKHEQGNSRKQQDKGGEKGDKRRTNYRRNKRKALVLLIYFDEVISYDTVVITEAETLDYYGSGRTGGNGAKMINLY